MPYIEVKAYPRDEATKKALAREINKAVLSVLQCPPEAVTVSVEDISPDDWQAQVVDKIIAPRVEQMFILDGKAVK